MAAVVNAKAQNGSALRLRCRGVAFALSTTASGHIGTKARQNWADQPTTGAHAPALWHQSLLMLIMDGAG